MPKLTQKIISAIKPREREFTVWDTEVPAFGVRVRPSGIMAYVLIYRPQGRRKTIGKPSVLTLEQARKQAKQFAAEVELGGDPAQVKTKRREGTLATAFQDYEATHLPKMSAEYQAAQRRLFKRLLIPKLGDKAIIDITRADIRELTDKLVAQKVPYGAINLHSAASAFLTWCVDRELIAANPLHRAQMPVRRKSRERWLDQAELVAIWDACERLLPHWRFLIRLLMLTGQRKGELLKARWEEFDLENGVWQLPDHRTKNRRAHRLQLSGFALEVLKAIPRADGQELLFPSTLGPRNPTGDEGEVPFTGFSVPVKTLKDAVTLSPWRIHDLRRSVATHMGKLGIAPHLISALLNHMAVRGVTAVYLRHRYDKEVGEALELWGRTLKQWLESASETASMQAEADRSART